MVQIKKDPKRYEIIHALKKAKRIIILVINTFTDSIDITNNLFTEEEIVFSKSWRKNHGKFMGRQNGSFWLKRTQSEYSSCKKEIPLSNSTS